MEHPNFSGARFIEAVKEQRTSHFSIKVCSVCHFSFFTLYIFQEEVKTSHCVAFDPEREAGEVWKDLLENGALSSSTGQYI